MIDEMTTSVAGGVGHADDDAALTAGRRAAERSVADLAGTRRLAYAFGSSTYDQDDLLRGIDEVLSCPVVGCSTAGEIAEDSSHTQSVTVLTIAGEGVEPAVGTAGGFDDHPRHAGMRAAEAAVSELDGGRVPTTVSTPDVDHWRTYPKLLVNAFGPGLLGSKEWAIVGVQDAVGWAQVSGGFAADDWNLDTTWVYDGAEPREDTMTVAALDLEVRTGVGVAHGLRGTEETFTVTEADVNRVRELDGRPALEVLRDVYGDQVTRNQFLITHPLGKVRHGEENEIAILYDPDEESGSLIVGEAPIEPGERLTIMDTSPEALLDGVETAVDRAMIAAGEPDEIAAVLIFDCNCRWYHLSDERNRDAEIEIVRDRVGEDVPIAGFYSYGEVATPSPTPRDALTSNTHDAVHHQSIAVQIITNDPL